MTGSLISSGRPTGAKRMAEMVAIFMIGDGVLGLMQPGGRCPDRHLFARRAERAGIFRGRSDR